MDFKSMEMDMIEKRNIIYNYLTTSQLMEEKYMQRHNIQLVIYQAKDCPW
jgi:hypothetical protein